MRTNKRFWIVLSSLALVFTAAPAWTEPQTIVTHEIERYFYRHGRMEKFEGQFEYTYLWDIDKNTLVRTRIYDYQTKKITPDETVYQVEKQLRSHPVRSERYALPSVIRAVGQTGIDTLELLSIEDDQVVSASSDSDEMVLSRAKRLK
jgi:hypothetical protein